LFCLSANSTQPNFDGIGSFSFKLMQLQVPSHDGRVNASPLQLWEGYATIMQINAERL